MIRPRLSTRSASTPPAKLKVIIPTPIIPIAAPTQNGESVSVRTSHPCTMKYRKTPMSLKAMLIHSSRNLGF